MERAIPVQRVPHWMRPTALQVWIDENSFPLLAYGRSWRWDWRCSAPWLCPFLLCQCPCAARRTWAQRATSHPAAVVRAAVLKRLQWLSTVINLVSAESIPLNYKSNLHTGEDSARSLGSVVLNSDSFFYRTCVLRARTTANKCFDKPNGTVLFVSPLPLLAFLRSFIRSLAVPKPPICESYSWKDHRHGIVPNTAIPLQVQHCRKANSHKVFFPKQIWPLWTDLLLPNQKGVQLETSDYPEVCKEQMQEWGG